jgi:hypothetical protein
MSRSFPFSFLFIFISETGTRYGQAEFLFHSQTGNRLLEISPRDDFAEFLLLELLKYFCLIYLTQSK